MPSATPCALLVQSFSGDPTVEDFRGEPALSLVPSRPHGTPLPRMPVSAEWSLVGQPTGLAEPAARPEPEAASECAPHALMAGSPGSGWERPFSVAMGRRCGPVR